MRECESAYERARVRVGVRECVNESLSELVNGGERDMCDPLCGVHDFVPRTPHTSASSAFYMVRSLNLFIDFLGFGWHFNGCDE